MYIYIYIVYGFVWVSLQMMLYVSNYATLTGHDVLNHRTYGGSKLPTPLLPFHQTPCFNVAYAIRG